MSEADNADRDSRDGEGDPAGRISERIALELFHQEYFPVLTMFRAVGRSTTHCSKPSQASTRTCLDTDYLRFLRFCGDLYPVGYFF